MTAGIRCGTIGMCRRLVAFIIEVELTELISLFTAIVDHTQMAPVTNNLNG